MKTTLYMLLMFFGACLGLAIGQATFSPPHGPVDVLPVMERGRITCMDRTRFLLTSEDGRKHCIRLVQFYGDRVR